MASIDLNADLGEGDAYDLELLQVVSSCNVACGGHAGDIDSMIETVRAAHANGVIVGAHPAYPDREGFGRCSGFASGEELRASLREQIDALREVVRAEGIALTHIKPHGALYTDAASDRRLADLVADVVAATDGAPALVGPPTSELQAAANARGITYLAEAFVDRAYHADGSLVLRSEPGAVHSELNTMTTQAVRLAKDGRVVAQSGDEIEVAADTLCIHGDTEGAAETARAVRDVLEANDVEIRAALRRIGTAEVIHPMGDDILGFHVEDAVEAQLIAAVLRQSGRWIEAVAGVDSVAVQYDPLALDTPRRQLQAQLREGLISSRETAACVDVPICYGGEFGPDLAAVCAALGCTAEDLIRLHTAGEYPVEMLGFTPGFAYIGGLPDELHLPRRAEPRQRVAPGSVGIADGRTGLYAMAGPGGWSLIGRTPLSLFDATSEAPFTLAAGMRVRFRQIDASQYEALASR